MSLPLWGRWHGESRDGRGNKENAFEATKGDAMRHNSKLTSKARELRKNMTKEERRLWYEYLSNHPHRFRRQVTCGYYIVDFYCADAKLAVELDGLQHYEAEGQAYDAKRTAYLDSLGIQVLRFSNLDVMQNLRGVCEAIDLAVMQRAE